MAERKITAWSWSRLSQYENCPAQCAYKNVDKVKEEQSPAMARGDRIHKEGEAWAKGGMASLPDSYAKFGTLMHQLKEIEATGVPLLVEQMWGYTKDWRTTGWFGPATWLRIKADVAIVYPDGDSDVIDYKTGREYEINYDQLELTALGVMRRYPQVERVNTRLWYLDSGVERPSNPKQGVYLTENSGEMMQKWEDRVGPMFADRTFAPKPGEHCHRCSFAKSKGGPCRFG